MCNIYTKYVYDDDEFVKPILQTITHLMGSWNTVHSFRDSVLVCKMHDCMIRKNFEHFYSFPSSDARWEQTTSKCF